MEQTESRNITASKDKPSELGEVMATISIKKIVLCLLAPFNNMGNVEMYSYALIVMGSYYTVENHQL